MSQRVSGYIQPQTWLQAIGNVVTLAASVATLSFTFAVFLGWVIQVVPNINTLFDRTNHLGALIDTPGGPLYVNSATDEVTIACNGSSIELCYFLHNLNLTGGSNVTLSTLDYTNAASFMSGVTNGKEGLDALVVHDQLQDTQITNMNTTTNSLLVTVTSLNTTVNNLPNITLSTLGYTNGASFMSGVTNGKEGLDALVVHDQLQDTQITNMNNTINSFVTSNGTTTLSTLPYTNGAFFMGNVTNGKGAFDNTIGEVVIQAGQIALLNAPTSRTFYVSATYGNDVTCDATKLKPCATLSKTLQFYPNVTNEFAQNTILFDNGLYSETNYIEIPPNTIFSGNEIGTLLIFGAGAGLHSFAWSSTGTGYVSFLRFGLIRCDAACNFDMATAAPGLGIFSVFLFYNSSIGLNAPMTFVRGTTGNPYFGVNLESTIIYGASSLIFQEMTAITWSISSDIYSSIVINYNSSTTFNGGIPTVSFNGLVPHTNIVLNNYAVGLTVDWSIMNVILRDAATMTRNYVSGAVINAHGDVLSLGSINGGLLSSGAGSGSTEYLTYAYGLGYTPANTTYWGISGVPVQVGDALDKLAKRAYDIESIIDARQQYVVTQFSQSGTSVTAPFYNTMNTGNQIVVGSSYFSTSFAKLRYIESVGHGFEFRGIITLSMTTAAVSALTIQISMIKNLVTYYPLVYTQLGGGTYSNTALAFSFSTYINLAQNDDLEMEINFSGGATSTAFIDNTPTNYFTFEQII